MASETAGLTVLTRAGNGDFAANFSLPLEGPIRVERGGGVDGSVIVVTNRRGPAQVLQFAETTVTLMALSVSCINMLH